MPPSISRRKKALYKPQILRKFEGINLESNRMRKIIFPLAVMAVVLVAVGCAGPERKLGRGLSNTYEIVRWGELRRSVEQNAVEGTTGSGCYGLIHGFDRSIARTGLGIAETVTFVFPTPTYDPMAPGFYNHCIGDDRVNPSPVFPSSYTPRRWSDALFDTDTYTGFSGGDVAPYVPGSRFSVFEN